MGRAWWPLAEELNVEGGWRWLEPLEESNPSTCVLLHKTGLWVEIPYEVCGALDERQRAATVGALKRAVLEKQTGERSVRVVRRDDEPYAMVIRWAHPL